MTDVEGATPLHVVDQADPVPVMDEAGEPTGADPDEAESVGFDRTSAASARSVIERVYPDETVRRTSLEVLADSVRHAHLANGGGWGLTLHPDRVRLNVDGMQVCVLRSGEIYLVIDQDALSQDELAEIAARTTGEWSGNVYKSFRSAYGVHIPDREVAEQAARVQDAHRRMIEAAARTVRTRPPFYHAHSPGMIAYLRQMLGTNVPTPDYGSQPGVSEDSRVFEQMADADDLLGEDDDRQPRRYWKISPGGAAKHWRDFQRRGVIAVHWSAEPNLTELAPTNEQGIKDALASIPSVGSGAPNVAPQL